MLFPLESLERVSTINRWTPSLSMAGSSQMTWPGGYAQSIDFPEEIAWKVCYATANSDIAMIFA